MIAGLWAIDRTRARAAAQSRPPARFSCEAGNSFFRGKRRDSEVEFAAKHCDAFQRELSHL
jgi:hypothetical protein